MQATVSAAYCSGLLFDKNWGFLAQLLLFPASNKQFTRFHGDLSLSPGILVVVYKHKIRLCIANKWFYASIGFMSLAVFYSQIIWEKDERPFLAQLKQRSKAVVRVE